VARFLRRTLAEFKGVVSRDVTSDRIDLKDSPRALREAMGLSTASHLHVVYSLPLPAGNPVYLNRTHPAVAGLASYVLDTTLDELGGGKARRCGAIRTTAVATRTTLLLLRLRFHVHTVRGNVSTAQLAEECRLLAFTGAPSTAERVADEEAERLLEVAPDFNILPEQARDAVRKVVSELASLHPLLETVVKERADGLLHAHIRVRADAQIKSIRYKVEPEMPPDILGIYVCLPVPKGGTQ
jgi:hypothetical protein